MMLGGLIGIFITVIYMALFVGFIILGWNAYLALRIYIRKNSDTGNKTDE
ncbi:MULTISPECIES: hypothetical protein [Butyricimonas]|uniref:Uncharacterized protein n=1 Tax=Butyricimonas hominis TaxID=2763032 RepID=A0ABR7CYY7_9BACT|nr:MULTISPECIES: hypothetical protein [Butyricimonas]MBC5620891.1 hypothetical protein [Butyricimonas hominis]MCB6970986.1 hypothetical protein [Butyricimonas synergistica]MCG4517700.1 hypothetical protein [Butyricimonas sp. DFI.6.44]